MTMRLVPLDRDLVLWAAEEEGDPLTLSMSNRPGWAESFCAAGTLGAALLAEGRVMAAGGLVPMWHGRALAWFMASPKARLVHKLRALRVVRGCLFQAQNFPAFRRVEMVCRADHGGHPAARLARFLDMTLEGRMTAFDPNGATYLLFARVVANRDPAESKCSFSEPFIRYGGT